MAAPRGPHHSGTFNRRSAQLNRQATANPNTICWRDGLTLAQHPAHKTGTPARWTTGHIDNLDLAQRNGARIHIIDGRPCAHEASTCNYSTGAADGNRAREPHTERW
jgi:hypothetical protein